MREELSNRAKWQDYAGLRGEESEKAFHEIMREASQDTPYEIIEKPGDLKGIYGRGYGIEPDSAIRNRRTKRTIFVEIKRQGAAGNAHERSCKYFAPGIVRKAREIGNIREEHFPFWLIYTGEMIIDTRYVREILFWFDGMRDHCFLWDMRAESLINRFNTRLKHVLD